MSLLRGVESMTNESPKNISAVQQYFGFFGSELPDRQKEIEDLRYEIQRLTRGQRQTRDEVRKLFFEKEINIRAEELKRLENEVRIFS